MNVLQGNRNHNFIIIVIMLFALLISPLFLLIVAASVLLVGNKNTWRCAIFGLSLAFAFFAMYIDPGAGDLQRYFGLLDVIEHLGFYETIRYFNDNLYAENIFFWSIAKIGDFSLVPFISSGIVYYVAMYITCKTAELYGQEKNAKWLILLQLLLLPFTSIAHNVRNVIAFALLILALYRDVYLKKMNLWTLLLYILGVTMHTTAILLIVLRVCLPIIRKSYVFIVVGVFFMMGAVNIGHTYSHLLAGIPLLQKMVIKAYNYLGDFNSDYGQIIAASTYQRVLKVLFALLTFLIIVYIVMTTRKKNSCHNARSVSSWLHLIFFVGMFVLFCCVQYTTPAYWRFFTIISMTLGTALLPISTTKQDVLSSRVFQVIGIFGIIITVLNVYVAFTNYNIFEWIAKFVTNANNNLLQSFLVR